MPQLANGKPKTSPRAGPINYNAPYRSGIIPLRHVVSKLMKSMPRRRAPKGFVIRQFNDWENDYE